MTMRALLVLSVIPFLLGNDGGCGTTGAQQSGRGIAPPAAWMRVECPDLPDIPADEGRKEVRRGYYKQSRLMYAQCKARHGGLNAFATTVTSR